MSGDDLLARIRALGWEEPEATEPAPAFDDDLVPDIEPYERKPEEIELDRLLDGLDILEAYNRWSGKGYRPRVGSKRESIMIRCPLNDHEDRKPSAWINLDKQVWTCGPCGFKGGDKYDIAAEYFGFGRDYKERFGELRRRMAQDLGYTVVSTGGVDVAEKAPVEPAPSTDAAGVADATDATTVVVFPTKDEEAQPPPSIDWRSIVPEETFLRMYLDELCELTDLPEEFHFWMGMVCLAAACGDSVVLESIPDIEPNLYVCLYGNSGLGKSRSVTPALQLIRQALPYDRDDPDSKGVLIAGQPASGEALLRFFSKPERDDADPKRVLRYCQVRGLVRFDELASLTGRASRTGNTLKPQIMSLYDGDAQGDAAMTREDTFVENPYCMMISTTQPGKVRDLLSQADADSGFVNRWIFAAGPPKPLRAYGGTRFDPAPLVMPLKRVHAWGAHGRRFRLEGEALEVWSEFFHRELEPLKVTDDVNPLLTRGDLTLQKLIILFAANEMNMQPTADNVRQAVALWPYLTQVYELVGGQIGTSVMDELAEAILEAVPIVKEKLRRDPSASDLWKWKLQGNKGRWTREMFAKTLYVLRGLGMIEELDPPVDADGRVKRGGKRYRVPAG